MLQILSSSLVPGRRADSKYRVRSAWLSRCLHQTDEENRSIFHNSALSLLQVEPVQWSVFSFKHTVELTGVVQAYTERNKRLPSSTVYH